MKRSYPRWQKRLLDLVIGGLMLVVLLPVLICISVIVRLKLGPPVLFRQWRPGRKAIPFVIYKFRTMTNECSPAGDLLPDDLRMTKFGQFLRGSSLDELPELFNVLRGEMSLVGPRPLLMDYLEHYTSEQARRHLVTPGITGWAQVNGRNAVSWEQKFGYDVWYVDHCGFFLDLRILMLTLSRVIRREGISATGYATMPPFYCDEKTMKLSQRQTYSVGSHELNN